MPDEAKLCDRGGRVYSAASCLSSAAAFLLSTIRPIYA